MQYDNPDDVFRHPPDEQPFIYTGDGRLSLQFDAGTVQSRMDPSAPYRLELGYTRTIMGFLLFVPQPRRIGLVGLGGGSLVKYCHRYLPQARIEVAEINPAVIALRDTFHIPADGPRLQIVCADGAEFVALAEPFDVLLIDGFDLGGVPPQLCSQRFYDDCRAALGADGVLAVNFTGDDPRIDIYCERLRRSFDGRFKRIPAQASSNRIVFAGRPLHCPPQRLRASARALASLHEELALEQTVSELLTAQPD